MKTLVTIITLALVLCLTTNVSSRQQKKDQDTNKEMLKLSKFETYKPIIVSNSSDYDIIFWKKIIDKKVTLTVD